MKPKKWSRIVGNLLTLLILAFVLWRQVPLFLNNHNQEGKTLPSREYPILSSFPSESLMFPPREAKVMAIFWASWCGPCKIEMNRLKSSIETGKISPSSVVAINPFEAPKKVRQFLAESPYPFIFLDAPEIASELNVSTTPTTVLIDRGVITSMGTGISLIGIWRAELFLDGFSAIKSL